MKTIKIFISFFILLGLLVPINTYAQVSNSLRVNYVEVTEEPDSLALGVYFTVIDDSNGMAVTNAQISAAEIILLDTNTRATASVKKADTPFYIMMVLDASGSMQTAGEDLREAAKNALGDVQNARYAILRFNDKIDLLQDFTDDKTRLELAIDEVVPVRNAGTCLYDAIYQAIEKLGQTPPGRRAVLVFTDGKDETLEKKFCSKHTYDEVVSLALQPDMHVPINTLGMSGKQQNINATELNNMASTTGGFSAIGTNLGAMFKQITDALNSQWLAKANIYPTKGRHDAVLQLKMKDESTLTATVSFESSRDYVVPPEPVSITVDGLEFNAIQDLYTVHLRFVSPQLIETLKIQVVDAKEGTVADEFTLNNLTSLQDFEFGVQNLVAKHDYQVKITAFGPGDEPITDEEGAQMVIVYKFSYNPESVKAEFTIPSVVIQEKQLDVKIQFKGLDQVVRYKTWLVNEATKSEVPNSAILLEKNAVGDTYSLSLEGLAGGKYTVRIQALDKDNNVVIEAQYEGVVYTPPKAPSKLKVLLGKIVSGLRANSWIIIAIVVIICLIIAGLFVLAFLARRETGTPVLQGKIETLLTPEQQISPINMTMVEARPVRARPPVAPARTVAQAPVEVPAAVLRVKQTPNPAEVGKTYRVSPLPLVVGREEGDLNFPDDHKVSRKHAKITYDMGSRAYFITDLGSVNGTWLDGSRIQANQPVRLMSGKAIGLGPDTILIFGN